MFEFNGGILSGKAPIDGHLLLIMPSGPGSHLLLGDVQGGQALRQALPIQSREVNFRHGEPGFHVWGCNGLQSADRSAAPKLPERPRRGRKADGY